MRHPRRRAWPAKAARIACTGLLAVIAAVPAAGAASGEDGDRARPGDGGACRGATVTRDYTAQSMTYRLHLDLEGCGWWDGSARNLVIWLSRDDGAGPASRYAMTPCTSDAGTACEVFVTLPHAVPESAVAYQGEATWEWKNGPERASFDTRCTTSATGDARCDS